MKNFNKTLITFLLAFTFNVTAASFNSSKHIKSIILNDDSIIFRNDILSAHLRINNSVDFIELNDGSRIEGSEVKSINYNNKPKFDFEVYGAKKSGDGSGG